MLLLATESASAVSDKLKTLFGDRIVVVRYGGRQDPKTDAEGRRVEARLERRQQDPSNAHNGADKALVVWCVLRCRDGDTTQIKIHVDDKVEFVKRSGTLYLEPVEYQIA